MSGTQRRGRSLVKPNLHFSLRPGTAPRAPQPVITLVTCGRNSYIWAGDDENLLGTLSGQTKLRKLAYAILREVPARKRGR